MRSIGLIALALALTACPGDDGTGDSGGSSSGTAGSESTSAMASTGTPNPTTGEASTGSPPPMTSSTGEPTGGGSDSTGAPETTGPGLEGDVLQNDSFEPTDSLTFQTWPNMSDCWASTFDANMSQYPFEIVGAIAAVGGGGGTETFEIGVWDVDPMGMPDTEIDSMTVDIDGSTMDFTEVDFSGLNLPTIMNGQFAIVMCHTAHMGLPSIATDDDGTVDPDRNWVFQAAMGSWVSSPDFFGIAGDFILRAVIMPV